MEQKPNTIHNSTGDKLYLAIALILLLVGIVFYYSTANSLSTIVRVLGLIGVMIVALGVAYLSPTGKRGVNFIGEARTEVRKVIWPTRQETIQMTLIVFLAVVVISLFLWAVDSLFLWAIELLIN